MTVISEGVKKNSVSESIFIAHNYVGILCSIISFTLKKLALLYHSFTEIELNKL